MKLLNYIKLIKRSITFNSNICRRSSTSPTLLLPQRRRDKQNLHKHRESKNSVNRKNPWTEIRQFEPESVHKITVVGAGAVGISVVNSVILQQISRNIVLIDKDCNKLEGEGLEYLYSQTLLDGCKVEASTDFEDSCNSKVVIITAGCRQKGDQSRLDLIQQNVDVFKEIIPPLIEFNPEAIFLIVTNPVDVLSWVTWKLTCLPFYKVIGCGTYVDTVRFKYLLSRELNCNTEDINAMILGEHGNSLVPVWSSIYDKNDLLRKRFPNCGLQNDDRFNSIAEAVKQAGPQIRCLKGYTNTTVALCVADILKSLLFNIYKIRPISVLAQGHYGIEEEVYLSLPCIIDNHGLYKLYNLPLDEIEIKQIQESAKILDQVKCQVVL